MVSHYLISCNVSVDAIGELRTKTQETGFFRVSAIVTKYSRKNPVSDPCYCQLSTLGRPALASSTNQQKKSVRPLISILEKPATQPSRFP
jgi:hypothetical protein